MTSMLTINAVTIERTEITVPAENFEVGYNDNFESLLERSRRNREAAGEELARNREELKEARRQLEEGLRTKREDLDAELKKASAEYQEYLKELEKKERGEEAAEAEAAKAESFGAERVHKRTALAAVVLAGTGLPGGFKNQVGTSLMASGKKEDALNGYLLTGGGRPTSFLKGTLERLGSLGQSWKLDKDALPELGNLFVESGVDPLDASNLISGLSQEALTLDNVLRAVAKADWLASQAEGAETGNFLTTTPGGLNNLGQYLTSLGLSTEVVKAVTSLAPGQSLSSYDLGSILTGESGDALAPLLSDGDLGVLVEALKSMGASQRTMSQLTLLLEANQGQANVNDLLGLLAFSEQPGPITSDPGQVASQIQNLLSRTSADSELVKTPLFNEIVMKMTLLGDRQITEDFADLSPALQALRGGVAMWRENQGDDFDRGGGERRQSREREERLMAQSGLKSQTLGWGLDNSGFDSALSQESVGYAGETLAKQISQKLLYSARRGVHRLKMNLDPESLGHLDVELKVKGEKLTANIKAESLEAYEALEKEMSSLKESLSQAGLELEMTLSYDGGEGAGGAMARSGYGRGQNGGESASALAQETEAEEENISGGEGRLLDRLV